MNRQNVLIRENMPESAEQGGGGGGGDDDDDAHSVGTSSAATPVSVVESTGDDTEDGAEAGGGGAVEEVQAGAVARARFVDDAEFKTIDIRSDHLEYMKHISVCCSVYVAVCARYCLCCSVLFLRVTVSMLQCTLISRVLKHVLVRHVCAFA